MIENQDTGERILPATDEEVSFVYTRHRFAYEFVTPMITGKNVLDVGCGSGYGSHLLAQAAGSVLGIDQSAEAIHYCNTHFHADNLRYQQHNASTHQDFSPFDMIVCFQVIEHIEDLETFIQQLKRWTIPGGRILISTPNALKRGKADPDNPYHVNEMDVDAFSAVLARHFEDFELQGVAFASENPLRSVIYKSGLYRLGRFLKRSSRIKKAASNAMDMTRFHVIRENISNQAADLLAVCINV